MTSSHEFIKEHNINLNPTKLRGIYAIYCISDDKLYIGQSKNIKERWKAHKRELKKTTHKNTYLQRAWDKYGETAFSFHIIMVSDEVVLNKHEADFLTKLPKEKYFNMVDPLKEQQYTEDRAKKISNKNTKRKVSQETLERLRSYNTNRVVSQETKELHRITTMGENNPFYGKKHTKESKEKMRISRQLLRGKIIRPRTLTDEQANTVRQRFISGISMSKLGKEYGLSDGTIRCLCIAESYICGAGINNELIKTAKETLILRKRK